MPYDADAPPNLGRLRAFVGDLAALLAEPHDEPRALEAGAALLARLIAKDDWLPEACAQPHPTRYRQYLLHCDSRERFSIVSFVWGPGQATPIHDHTVWGLVGVLRGAELSQRYLRVGPRLIPDGPVRRLERGEVEAVSPALGDLHQVSNAVPDKPSVSIHVYGGNIGAVRRHTFDVKTGEPKLFVSGYTNKEQPNLWDRSAEVRAQP